MESFYDIGHVNDLRDIWDTDFDPSETLKLSSDADLHDWFSDREIKMSQVILHDKLISDALLGNVPIKTEHSYSLNSDGDSSIPDSPESLQTKMDGIDDDNCSIVSSNVFSNIRTNKHSNNTPSSILLSQTATTKESLSAILLRDKNESSSSNNKVNNNENYNTESKHHHHRFQYKGNHHMPSIATGTEMEHNNMDTESNESSSDIDSANDIHIKDEPMSPESSCPSSPSSNSFVMSLNMANMPTSSFTNTHIMFGHKKDELTTMKRTPTAANVQIQRRVIIPAKCNIKIEPQQNSTVFGLPPTPPSSLPSDESEGNQSPEHHLISPVSPANNVSTITTATAATTTSGTTIVCFTPPSSSSSSTTTTAATTTKRTSSSFGGVHYSSSSAVTTTTTRSGGGYSSGTSTRQPIHTPLISTQPKGSTGALILTDEEKRTLLAEGYPIPTRLPLTKAEEKSLKKIRRKIKNKISAQESRRKKKEYMDQLERKVEILVTENADYRKKLETLEMSNANLLDQLARLQALLTKQQQSLKNKLN